MEIYQVLIFIAESDIVANVVRERERGRIEDIKMDWYYEKYNLKVNTNAIGSAEYKQTQITPITPLPINIEKILLQQ